MLKSENQPSANRSHSGNAIVKWVSTAAERLSTRTAHVAVLGLGYAGLPMAVEFARSGFDVTGIDVDEEKVHLLNKGQSPVSNVGDVDIANLIETGKFRATSTFDTLAKADCALICVPTPLTADKEPDLRFVKAAAHSIASHLHPGMLVVLQSTCGPETTRRILLPILESHGDLTVGEDFFVAYAPERIDPGNKRYTISNTPKVLGGISSNCRDLAVHLFSPIVENVIPVSSPEVAEMSKLVENTFRFVNISFINEMALLCDRMGISIWETIDAAATKPFAYMSHYPGPGVGGHCIPVVPFFLRSAAREAGMVTHMINAASCINDEMPNFVIAKLEQLLKERGGSLEKARVLLLGVAYKPDVSDIRESPSLRVLETLSTRGVNVLYYDPFVPSVALGETAVTSLTAQDIDDLSFDCAVLLTAHSCVDYDKIAEQVHFVLDTRCHMPLREGVIRI